ncbi:MAG TPA: helix-turn-helix transcriptional regulator [Candidatus Dojkabacteria bacterium]|nr:helix-turn-helix transcriptional regulator [Candidatus Dojkabacteria bacterium]
MSFHKNLEYLRKEKNISQEDLAFKLGVSRQAVLKWESGAAYPETAKMIAMCKIFDCTLDELINEDMAELKKNAKRSYTFNDLLDEVTNILDRTSRMFDSMNRRSILRFLFEMFLFFLFFILLLNIPLNYIFRLGDEVLINIPGDVAQLFISIWHLVTGVVYIVVAVASFVYIYKIRFLDKFEEAKEIDSKEAEKENETSVKQEIKKDEDRKVEIKKYDFGIFTFLGKIALFFIKSFVLFISLPIIIFLLFCTVVGVVVGIVLMFNRVFFVGVVICLLSVIAFAVGLLNIIYNNFIVNHRSNWQKLFIVFIVSIVGLGVGAGISVFEFSKMTISSEAPVHVKSSVKVETFQMQEDMYLSNRVYYYVVDNTLGDLVKVEVTYYDVLTEDVIIQSYDNPSYIQITTKSKQSVNLGQLYNILIEDLKNRRLSNYTALGQYKFKVYASEENIGKLQRNLEKQINMSAPPAIEEGVN